MQTEANREAGLPEAEARRRARVALGSVEAVKERSRDARPLRWARDLMQDLRYAHRSLLRAPGFTAVAIATLALGIGANTALFSVVSAVVLRPLPYPDADRLVRVWSSQPQIGLPRSATALPDYRAWRTENRTFDELGAFIQEFTSTHFLVARTAGDPLASTAAIQHVVNRADPNLALANVRPMDSLLSASLAERRFAMRLLGGFAGLALLLALVGLYGVMAYTVGQRRKELGVRSAMGASPAALLRLVLGDGLRMTVGGLAIGLILTGALSRFMTAHLFGIEAIDPTVYAGVAVLFVAAACLACGVPALQAARVDPITTLRGD